MFKEIFSGNNKIGVEAGDKRIEEEVLEEKIRSLLDKIKGLIKEDNKEPKKNWLDELCSLLEYMLKCRDDSWTKNLMIPVALKRMQGNSYLNKNNVIKRYKLEMDAFKGDAEGLIKDIEGLSFDDSFEEEAKQVLLEIVRL